MPENTLFTFYSSQPDEVLLDLTFPGWHRGFQARIERFWEGSSIFCEDREGFRNFSEVRSIWNDGSLFFLFECWFDKLNLGAPADRHGPVRGLWEGDVVEVLLGPKGFDRYFEIEVSPSGQWLDILVYRPRVDMDFRWESGVKVEAEIQDQKKIWKVCLRLPFQPILESCCLNRRPEVGDVWRLNLCRVAGEKPDRQYLSWRPTFTPKPDFHVPSSFGNLLFLSES